MPSVQADRRFGLNSGLAVKAPCLVATIGPITLSGEQVISGMQVLAVNNAGLADRVLVVGQTNPQENGIYDVNIGDWKRSKDFDGEFDVTMGTIVPVFDGHVYTPWILTSPVPINFGFADIVFLPQSSIVNPMSALGDMIRGAVAGAALRLPIGTPGQVLTSSGGIPTWATLGAFANPMNAEGDLIVGGVAGAAGRQGIGSPGQVLTVTGATTLGWATPTALPLYLSFAARRITTDFVANSTIIYQDTSFTSGHNDTVSGTPIYSTSTGQFTVPAGFGGRTWALESSNILHNGTGGALSGALELRINGSVIITKAASIDAGISMTIVFCQGMRSLNVGDTVEISLLGAVALLTQSTFSMRTAF